MTVTAGDIIKGAYRALQRIGVNETPTNEEYDVGLELLNEMLDTFSIRGLFIYATNQITWPLESGTYIYSIGSGGESSSGGTIPIRHISGDRPTRIEGALIRHGDIDYPVDVLMTEDEYRRISSKDSGGRPIALWYKPSYPLGYIYLWPAPDTDDYSLIFDVYWPLTEFSSIRTEVSLPPGYRGALKYNLAVRLAPEHGIVSPPEVVGLAASTLRTVENLNAAYHVEPVYPPGHGYLSSYKYTEADFNAGV